VYFRKPISNIQPTKCAILFIRYLYYNITLNISTCFDLQGIISPDDGAQLEPKHVAMNKLVKKTGVVCDWYNT